MVAGVLCFSVGTAVNFGSELARHLWKRDRRNAGKPYTLGAFALARHANYTARQKFAEDF
mgnify:CR=1 FL=1